MSRKYKFRDNSKLYFVSFAVINWIDVFIRNEYKQVLLDSFDYCPGLAGMTSHVHLIIGSRGNPMHNIIRDMKSHTSTQWRQLLAGIHTKAGRSACPDFPGDAMDDGKSREEEF
jgi:putative transposase